MAELLRSSPAVLRRPLLLDGFGARMAVHAPASNADRVAGICAAEQLGAVYTIPTTGSRSSMFATAAGVLRTHRLQVGAVDSVLLDAQRYSGNNRVPGTEPHDLGWTAHQHRNGQQWALTDSGYIAENDELALRATLEEGTRHTGHVVVALPLHASWLRRRADYVRRRIETAGRPVAVMLEHSDDPLGSRKTLQGLLEILHASVPVALLRCDVSAVGALAYGAATAAVGTKTGLRHIFPSRPGGGGLGRGKTAAVVPRALAYRQLDKIREAVVADSDQTRWVCNCSWCAGALLDGIFTEEDAFHHSLATLAELANGVITSPDPGATWKSMCFDAQFSAYDIAAETGLDWPVPRFLGHWLTA